MYREMAKEGVFLPPSQFEEHSYLQHIVKKTLKTIQAFDTVFVLYNVMK